METKCEPRSKQAKPRREKASRLLAWFMLQDAQHGGAAAVDGMDTKPHRFLVVQNDIRTGMPALWIVWKNKWCTVGLDRKITSRFPYRRDLDDRATY